MRMDIQVYILAGLLFLFGHAKAAYSYRLIYESTDVNYFFNSF